MHKCLNAFTERYVSILASFPGIELGEGLMSKSTPFLKSPRYRVILSGRLGFLPSHRQRSVTLISKSLLCIMASINVARNCFLFELTQDNDFKKVFVTQPQFWYSAQLSFLNFSRFQRKFCYPAQP